ncbi:hypothetical protein HK098_003941 [Nowakowskiella sp. JEL0407]|nr:hypothetical protein HK098_003941 [Nowakowskiella sp. JEL0407]
MEDILAQPVLPLKPGVQSSTPEEVVQILRSSAPNSEMNTISFEIWVRETEDAKKSSFDQFVDMCIAACKLPLFKATFLSSIIFEFLFPISNQPYLDPKRIESKVVQDELWETLKKLHNAIESMRKDIHSVLSEDVVLLLSGLDVSIQKGSMITVTDVCRSVVGNDVTDAVFEYILRNPLNLVLGPIFAAVNSTSSSGVVELSPETLVVGSATYSENESVHNIDLSSLSNNGYTDSEEQTSSAVSFVDDSEAENSESCEEPEGPQSDDGAFTIVKTYSQETITEIEEGTNSHVNDPDADTRDKDVLKPYEYISSKSEFPNFDKWDDSFRKKISELKSNVFPSSDSHCNQGKQYHDIFISYKKGPESEEALNLISIGLHQIQNRRLIQANLNKPKKGKMRNRLRNQSNVGNNSRPSFHWFLDVDCLPGGRPFTDEFLGPLLHAKVLFLVITPKTIENLDPEWDNMILEWEWGLKLRSLHFEDTYRMQPIFVGRKDEIEKSVFKKVRDLRKSNTLNKKHGHERSPCELTIGNVIQKVFDLQGSRVESDRTAIINQLRVWLEIDEDFRKILG